MKINFYHSPAEPVVHLKFLIAQHLKKTDSFYTKYSSQNSPNINKRTNFKHEYFVYLFILTVNIKRENVFSII